MKHVPLFTFCVISALLVLTPLIARAAVANVPSSADAGRIEERLSPLKAPALREMPAAPSTAPLVQAPAGAENMRFVLTAVTLKGATVYPARQLSLLYKSRLGKNVSLADVYAIAQSITAKYRNDGYILSQAVVPPQTIDGGRVTLRVIEGFVDKAVIQGGQGADISLLQRLANNIAAVRPLNEAVLERNVLLMNDLAGITARAVLSPSALHTGAATLTIAVSQKPYDVFLQEDNRGSRYLGPFQSYANTQLNNRFGLGEAASFSFMTTPGSRALGYAALGWSQPIDARGTTLSFSASVTQTRPAFTLAPFDVRGRAHTYSLSLSHPFIRTRTKNLSAALMFDTLDSTRTDNLGGAAVNDRLRVLRLNGSYQSSDAWLTAAGGANALSLQLSKGLPVLNASRKGDGNMTRARGNPQFFKGTFNAARTQRLSGLFSFYGAVFGQWSPDTLLASEEFGLGGASFGSAYDSSEITGENGVAARLELRADHPSPAPAAFVQFYGFYDIGKVWDKDNAVARDRQMSLADAGAGVRVNMGTHMTGSLELAIPLTRAVATTGDKNPRLFGSLTASF